MKPSRFDLYAQWILATIDAREAQAAVDSDREMIHAMIDNGVGFGESGAPGGPAGLKGPLVVDWGAFPPPPPPPSHTSSRQT